MNPSLMHWDIFTAFVTLIEISENISCQWQTGSVITKKLQLIILLLLSKPYNSSSSKRNIFVTVENRLFINHYMLKHETCLVYLISHAVKVNKIIFRAWAGKCRDLFIYLFSKETAIRIVLQALQIGHYVLTVINISEKLPSPTFRKFYFPIFLLLDLK